MSIPVIQGILYSHVYVFKECWGHGAYCCSHANEAISSKWKGSWTHEPVPADAWTGLRIEQCCQCIIILVVFPTLNKTLKRPIDEMGTHEALILFLAMCVFFGYTKYLHFMFEVERYLKI